YDADSLLQGTIVLGHDINILLKCTVTTQYTVDVPLTALDYDADSLLQGTIVLGHDINILLKCTVTTQYTVDVPLTALDYTIDTHTQTTRTSFYACDVLLRGPITLQYTTDVLLKGLVTLQYTTDVPLTALDYTLDTHTQITFTLSHSIDVLLKGPITTQYFADTLLTALCYQVDFQLKSFKSAAVDTETVLCVRSSFGYLVDVAVTATEYKVYTSLEGTQDKFYHARLKIMDTLTTTIATSVVIPYKQLYEANVVLLGVSESPVTSTVALWDTLSTQVTVDSALTALNYVFTTVLLQHISTTIALDTLTKTTNTGIYEVSLSLTATEYPVITYLKGTYWSPIALDVSVQGPTAIGYEIDILICAVEYNVSVILRLLVINYEMSARLIYGPEWPRVTRTESIKVRTDLVERGRCLVDVIIGDVFPPEFVTVKLDYSAGLYTFGIAHSIIVTTCIYDQTCDYYFNVSIPQLACAIDVFVTALVQHVDTLTQESDKTTSIIVDTELSTLAQVESYHVDLSVTAFSLNSDGVLRGSVSTSISVDCTVTPVLPCEYTVTTGLISPVQAAVDLYTCGQVISLDTLLQQPLTVTTLMELTIPLETDVNIYVQGLTYNVASVISAKLSLSWSADVVLVRTEYVALYFEDWNLPNTIVIAR
ncbi:hypothetical protein DRO59_08345, partial [Candidatus Bathyarchaeota archaeon]